MTLGSNRFQASCDHQFVECEDSQYAVVGKVAQDYSANAQVPKLGAGFNLGPAFVELPTGPNEDTLTVPLSSPHPSTCVAGREAASTPPNPPMPRTLQLTGARGRAFDAGPGYALRHVIGRGAFGCVMAAECRATGRGVAVKQVADAGEDAAAARRLLRELRLLRLLGGHLNVIRLLDVVVADAGGQVSAQLKSRSRLRLLAKSAPQGSPSWAIAGSSTHSSALFPFCGCA